MWPRRSISQGLTVSRPESMKPDSSRGRRPRLVRRAIPLHEARLDGGPERGRHGGGPPGVEIHVTLRDREGRAESAARRFEQLVAGAHALPLEADEPALDVVEVSLQELRLEAPDGRHGGERAPVFAHVGGPGMHLVVQVEDGVGNPLEVIGDGEVLEGVAFPRLHHAAIRLAPTVLVHPSVRLRGGVGGQRLLSPRPPSRSAERAAGASRTEESECSLSRRPGVRAGSSRCTTSRGSRRR